MSEKKSKKDDSRVEKKQKKFKGDAKSSKEKNTHAAAAAASAFRLLADDKTVDPALSSLFAVKQPPVKVTSARAERDPREVVRATPIDEQNDAELSELDEDADLSDADSGAEAETEVEFPLGAEVLEARDPAKEVAAADVEVEAQPKRKRKRKDAGEEVEDAYMSRLAREEEKDAAHLAAERAAKRQKQALNTVDAKESVSKAGDVPEDSTSDEMDVYHDDEDAENAAASPLPKHETQEQADEELSKANRTVFVGNVSTAAISSKSARKILLNHLGSFSAKLSGTEDEKTKHKVESIRFRSTPYASAIPKKAAFAKKELMDATTKSTNAYVVYSSQQFARDAAKRLNGSLVLDRHIRVDEVAHPAKVDHRRCVFVGNLGFVDDESNIQDANEEEGREKRKRGKEPADVEEGLWRTFGKCGKVESVRVIRDSTTRVGKGIAYVQFEDENAVEAALLLNEKKFPPMLPRKLRVSRAKAQKRNVKPGSDRPSAGKPSANGYQRKLTGAEASKLGRTSKLFGRAAAAKMRRPERGALQEKPHGQKPLAEGIKRPENFIFEGHRASARQGKSGLKLGGKHTGSKKTKITKRSAGYKAKTKAA